jgi:hypothetical protein
MMEGSSVTIIHSTSFDEDKELLSKILPDNFELENIGGVEKSATKTASFSSSDEQTILLVSTTTDKRSTSSSSSAKRNKTSRKSGTNKKSHTGSSYAIILLKDDGDIQQIAENISNTGGGITGVEEATVSSSSVVKFTLPGGCRVVVATRKSWQDVSMRCRITEYMIEIPSSSGTGDGTGSEQENTSVTRSKRSFLSLTPSGRGKSIVQLDQSSVTTDLSSSMRRSSSMPTLIPPLVTTTTSTRSQSRIFPSLRTQVLSLDNEYCPFPLNSQTPIPVESDLFVGHLLLIMRPNDPEKEDPFWNERLFAKKKRRVAMRLQGQLKYKPSGTLMAGMEISDPMNLGLLASGLCNIILKMVKSFNPAINYSFGSDEERAHICFPASTFFERLVVTPPDEAPPDIMEEFEEPLDSVKKRKAYKTKIDWNTEDIYSMSFHSMYIDFPSWSVVKLPVGRDVALQTFWGESTASVVFYEVPDNEGESRQQISTNRYILGVELKFLGKDAAPLDDRASDGDTEWSEDQFVESEVGSVSTTNDRAIMPPLEEGAEESDLEFFDAFQSQDMLPDGDVTETTLDLTPTSPHNNVLQVIDEFCPCWIEMFSRRGKYTTVYAFHTQQRPDRPLFRTVEMAEEAFGRPDLIEVDDRFSHRLSTEEKTRRVLGLKFAEAHLEKGKREKLNLFAKIVTRFDTKFLSPQEVSTEKVSGHKSGFVARGLSDRHWIEERIVLQNDEIVFHHMERSKIHLHISLSSIVRVSTPEDDVLLPLPNFSYLQIETFGRVTYLMFHSEEERDSWLETLQGRLTEQLSSSRSFTNHLINVDDPMNELLHKSTMWDCQKRRILNCRKFSFQTRKSTTPQETLDLAERALSKVMALQPKGPDDADLRDFLDCAACLKDADAHTLNEEQRLAFFLNVYHIFIMHAYIVLSPPNSSLEWVSYFTTIAYQCSDDIFSLAELEHNIIRAEMSYPSQFLSRFILPKSHYLFALTRGDFRINFALNPGSLSMPSSSVPLYNAETIDRQLDNVTRGFIEEAVSVKVKGSKDVNIVLPRLFQWFGEDFGSNGTANDALVKIEPYLTEEQRNSLRLIWNGKKKCYDIGIFSLKYLNYNYECRFLTLEGT